MNTVDLKEKMKRQQEQAVRKKPASKPKLKPKKAEKSKAEGIDEVFLDTEEIDNNFKKIDQPIKKEAGDQVFKQMTVVLSLLLVVAVFYILFFSINKNVPVAEEKAPQWYMVKLMNGEIYYGEITDTSADPLVINKVYYNYDQLNSSASSEQEKEGTSNTGNLRLVKRGQEPHGPDGSMHIIRSQVEFLEPLKTDSKVLKAILEYEN